MCGVWQRNPLENVEMEECGDGIRENFGQGHS